MSWMVLLIINAQVASYLCPLFLMYGSGLSSCPWVQQLLEVYGRTACFQKIRYETDE